MCLCCDCPYVGTWEQFVRRKPDRQLQAQVSPVDRLTSKANTRRLRCSKHIMLLRIPVIWRLPDWVRPPIISRSTYSAETRNPTSVIAPSLNNVYPLVMPRHKLRPFSRLRIFDVLRGPNPPTANTCNHRYFYGVRSWGDKSRDGGTWIGRDIPRLFGMQPVFSPSVCQVIS